MWVGWVGVGLGGGLDVEGSAHTTPPPLRLRLPLRGKPSPIGDSLLIMTSSEGDFSARPIRMQ